MNSSFMSTYSEFAGEADLDAKEWRSKYLHAKTELHKANKTIKEFEKNQGEMYLKDHLLAGSAEQLDSEAKKFKEYLEDLSSFDKDIQKSASEVLKDNIKDLEHSIASFITLLGTRFDLLTAKSDRNMKDEIVSLKKELVGLQEKINLQENQIIELTAKAQDAHCNENILNELDQAHRKLSEVLENQSLKQQLVEEKLKESKEQQEQLVKLEAIIRDKNKQIEEMQQKMVKDKNSEKLMQSVIKKLISLNKEAEIPQRNSTNPFGPPVWHDNVKVQTPSKIPVVGPSVPPRLALKVVQNYQDNIVKQPGGENVQPVKVKSVMKFKFPK